MTLAGAPKGVDAFDRVMLGHWPTPVERMPRLEDALGGTSNGVPHLYIKRDDCSGLGLGGNKVRKLEFLCGQALAQGADTLITVGALQSNHARQTAAAAAKLGLKCHLILPNLVGRAGALYESSGNPLLDRLFGAEVHVVASTEAAIEKGAEVMAQIEASGGKSYFIPAGGSSDIGTLGFVTAATELRAFERAQGWAFDRVVLAASTGGTLAGLATGFHAEGAARKLEVVMVFEPADELAPKLNALLEETAALLGSGKADAFELMDGYIGEGYGIPTVEANEAVRLVAGCEGVLLDPVYTGKAMAALTRRAQNKTYGAEERVLFWHTGGTPALFAYGDAF